MNPTFYCHPSIEAIAKQAFGDLGEVIADPDHPRGTVTVRNVVNSLDVQQADLEFGRLLRGDS